MVPARLHRPLTLAFGLILVACGGGGGSSPSPAPTPTVTLQSIALAPSGPTLNIGGSVDLTANASYSDGSTAPVDNSAVWTSSNPAVASVSAMGVVTGLAAGSTTISASKDGKAGVASVTVTASAVSLTGLSLNATNLLMFQGGAIYDLTATATWSNGTATVPYDSNVAWTSSNPAVATVNAGGVVTPVAGGTAVITASASGHSATCNVTVQVSVSLSSLSLNPTTGSLTAGQTLDITATANWSNGTSTVPYDSGCSWTTSNPAVATVNAGGVVSAVGAGSAVITASAAGRSATCTVTVSAPAASLTSITLNPTSGSLTPGQTLDITATANWSNGTATSPYDSSCTWTSSNTAVATVNAGGVVTAVGAGSATITAAGGGRSATCAITVTSASSFDSRLVGNWSFTDITGTWGSFYHFYANGTFTYSLVYINRSSCISTAQVVAYHSGTFSTVGSLDNLASPAKIVFTCSTHYTDYTACNGAVSRSTWGGANPHFHWAALVNATTLRSTHDDDFNPTGNLDHAKQ